MAIAAYSSNIRPPYRSVRIASEKKYNIRSSKV